MSSLRRLDLIALGLMLAYVVVVFVRVFYRYQISLRRIGIDADDRSLRKVAVYLRMQVGNLKSIACVAPYLGLVGTCIGIFDAIGGIGMEKHSALLRVTSLISAAPLTAAAGILVAVAATCVNNHLRIRLNLLQGMILDRAFAETRQRFQNTRRFPVARRISSVPAFALIAPYSLAMALAGAMIGQSSLRASIGLGIGLAPDRCEFDGDDRPIVLRINHSDEVFINLERQDWNTLSKRLSEIYSMKTYRTIYVDAEDDIPFQTVADAIDIAVSISLNVRLITPAAMKTRCLEPVAIRSPRHVRMWLPGP